MFDRYETKVVFTYPHADDTGLFGAFASTSTQMVLLLKACVTSHENVPNGSNDILNEGIEFSGVPWLDNMIL